MRFRIEPHDREIDFTPEAVIVATHTGRDRNAVEAHVAELEKVGVRAPTSVPAYVALPAGLLSQSAVHQTTSANTSGEAEFALLVDPAATYVAIASDHTDRDAQQLNAQLSKQVCAKAIGESAWRLDDVEAHWDQLVLRGWTGDDSLDLYQEGALAALHAPRALLGMLPWRQRTKSFVVLGGTLPAIGGIRSARRFRAELADPRTGRTLSLEYRTEVVEPLTLPAIRPTTALISLLRRAERRLDR